MKKRIIRLILLVVILLVYVCSAVGCMLFPIVYLPETVLRPEYAEYFDENEKIYFRTVDGHTGFGYLMLNGKKIPAKYYIDHSIWNNKVMISVYIPREEDLRDDVEPTNNTYAFDTLTLFDKEYNKNKVLTARGVTLFGETFEKVTLYMNQLEKSDFEPWEYQLRWESKVSEEWKILEFVGMEEVLNLHKCVRIYARKSELDQTKACILKWLPDIKGFEIYEIERQDQFVPLESQQPIATGTYVLREEVVTLTFVTDGVFDGAYPTLELILKNQLDG